ncbi:MAG: ABC transporter permease subunit [Paracoccus sp. (in: a-proteobacteria)]|uniref:amino acid ABC transporter permease n=1 Tax=Paracoccus sp. TaxID=267 RepID=UPI0026E03F87|nr:ABC transporter permease subunit [Paracoccus sp. (in: a-proteobacteria)]MDO5613606.1 ABC transporter permease subunit [Paracoccus sp. (in: a-proteobacteria)]
MTDFPGPGRQPFRPSMLIYDRRYRSMTFQVIVFILFMLFAWWLIGNTIANLARVNKDFNFGFLWQRAGYDVPQVPIPYTSDDTHFRATLVGLVNTLIVSVLGCIAATVLGVIVGVARLSGNWLIARLMTVYVEIFRNMPLLLWILIILAIFTELLPPPNAFRGDNPIASMILFDSVALTNRYTAVPALGMANDPGSLSLGGVTIGWAVIAFAAALTGGWFLRRAINRRAQARQDQTGRRPVTWWINLAVMVVPSLLLIRYFGIELNAPELRGFNFAGGMNLQNALIVLWLALTLYTAAFIAEIVRAGIMAVSKGQTEAAYALGLRPNRTMQLVILPQALRVIIPPLISQYLNLTKNSSLAIAVGYMDLRGTLGGTTLNQTGRELESIVLMMLIYLALSLMISGLMNIYNARVRLKER